MVKIRPAGEEDRRVIRKMVFAENLDPTSLKWQNFLVAELVGSIVGIGQVRKHRGCRELGSLVVLKEYRRKGIGRMLMAAAEAWAKRNGLDYIGLNVSSRNEAAIALYREEGFEIETFRMWKKIG